MPQGTGPRSLHCCHICCRRVPRRNAFLLHWLPRSVMAPHPIPSRVPACQHRHCCAELRFQMQIPLKPLRSRLGILLALRKRAPWAFCRIAVIRWQDLTLACFRLPVPAFIPEICHVAAVQFLTSEPAAAKLPQNHPGLLLAVTALGLRRSQVIFPPVILRDRTGLQGTLRSWGKAQRSPTLRDCRTHRKVIVWWSTYGTGMGVAVAGLHGEHGNRWVTR